MRYVTTLIKNVGKYAKSIALIISKGPSVISFGDISKQIPESITINRAVDFLVDFRQKLNDAEKIDLLNAILDQRDG